MEEIPESDFEKAPKLRPLTRTQSFGLLKDNKEEAIAEVKEVFALSWPVVLSQVLTMLLNNTNILFLGRIGNEELAGAGLAIMFCNVTGLSWIFGLLSAMETLVSQANGAQNYKRVGIIVQRALAISLIAVIPIIFLWLFSENILLLMRINPAVAKLSGDYCRILTISAYPTFITEIMKKYLQMQGKMYPPIFSGAFATGINPLFQYVAIKVLGLGFKGSAYATVLAQLMNCLSLFLIIIIQKHHVKTWFGWSMEAFHEWKEFFKLGLPGAAMVCLEWGSFEIVALAVGLLHRDDLLAAHFIIANTVALCWMIPSAFGVAGSTRVGNFLGAGDAFHAKISSLIVILMGLGVVTLLSFVLCVARSMWASIFTDNEDVASAVSNTLLLVCFTFTPADGMQGNMGGLIRGAGKQKWGAIVNLASFYGLGIPVAFAATLWLKWGLYGAWSGLSLAEIAISVGYIFVILRMDWSKEAEIAKARALGEFELLESNEMENFQIGDEEEDTKSTKLDVDIIPSVLEDIKS